jgi:uncharacterized protein YbdZ (MbtH family)
MFSMLTSGGVDCRFEPISGQTKDYKTGICCFSAKRAPLRRKFRDWLVKWSDMSTPGLRRKCRDWLVKWSDMSTPGLRRKCRDWLVKWSDMSTPGLFQ